MGGFAAAYLTAYNAIQAAVWTGVLAGACGALATHTVQGAGAAAYEAVGATVTYAQTATAVETLHAALGLTRSGVVGNVAQWAGRTHCWYLVCALPELQRSSAVALLLLCWALADVVRYAWAAASTAGRCPASLTWLRYNLFIPLYPLGAASEVALMMLAVPASKGAFRRLSLPNAANFAWDNARFLLVVLCIYPPCWLALYSHMFRQRARRAQRQLKQP
jgi:very-long-chain (3R)-3-hydroxyacyl-CoA dehydratase